MIVVIVVMEVLQKMRLDLKHAVQIKSIAPKNFIKVNLTALAIVD